MSPTAPFPAPATATAPTVAPTAPTAPAAPASPAAPSSALSISSLVLGLVSVFAGWTFFAPVAGVITGFLALSREPHNRTMAIWGIVLNAVMLAGFLLFGLVAVIAGLAVLPFLPFALF
jgi:hypothetical protein